MQISEVLDFMQRIKAAPVLSVLRAILLHLTFFHAPQPNFAKTKHLPIL